MNKILYQLWEWRRTEEEEKCLQAFRTTNYETQKNLNPEREAETCLWCLNDERFINWRDKSTSCLLWVTADPGCGKSVLSRALVDERLFDSASNDTTTCYFFFKDTSEDQRSPVCALAALLHQLFKSKAGPKVIKHALPAFRENKDKISRNFEAMWGVVQAIALDSDCGKITFLLDALDECESSEQWNLITKLKQLEQIQTRHGRTKEFKFFITSRPYWNIEKEFDSLIRDIPSIRLKGENQSEGIRSEIDRVIKARVSRLGHQIASEKARKELLRGLLKIENRTYLWLHLIFDLIAVKPRIDTKLVESLLQHLPTTVETAYDAILQRSSDQERAKRLLHIVLAAVRPLSVNELGIALYITDETRTFEDLELQDGGQLEMTIRDLCGLFISIVERKVFLIHQTAKEFLIAKDDFSCSTSPSSGVWKRSLSIRDSNFVLASICIWFLRLEEFHGKGSYMYWGIHWADISKLVSRYDFFEYSAMNWAVHFRAAMIPEGHSLVALGLELCYVPADRYMSWEIVYWEKAMADSPLPTGGNNLQLASLLGLERVVGQLLSVPRIKVNAADNSGRTPLWWATFNEHEAVIYQLLAVPGINVNKADRLEKRTPLWWASSNGHEAVVRLLLAMPSIDVNKADKDGGTPLWWASSKGHEAVVRLLLAEPSIDVNATDEDGETALWQASSNGHEEVVRQLLAMDDIDVNIFNTDHETPLWQASSNGHKAIVRQLLTMPNIDIRAANREGKTAQMVAHDCGYKDIMHLFLWELGGLL
jgi:ankyrin repeat protein